MFEGLQFSVLCDIMGALKVSKGTCKYMRLTFSYYFIKWSYRTEFKVNVIIKWSYRTEFKVNVIIKWSYRTEFKVNVIINVL